MEDSDDHIASARTWKKNRHTLNLCHVVEFGVVEHVILDIRVAIIDESEIFRFKVQDPRRNWS